MIENHRKTLITRPVLHVSPHLLVSRYPTIAEECHRRSGVEGSILNFTLGREIFDRFDRSDHAFDSQEGGWKFNDGMLIKKDVFLNRKMNIQFSALNLAN